MCREECGWKSLCSPVAKRGGHSKRRRGTPEAARGREACYVALTGDIGWVCFLVMSSLKF